MRRAVIIARGYRKGLSTFESMMAVEMKGK
jgi:hypothetical protein